MTTPVVKPDGTYDLPADVAREREEFLARNGLSERGGPGSGHYGHAGIPGHRGGSLPGEATGQPEEAKGGLPSFALEARDIMQANSLYWPSTVKVVPESDIPIANKELFEAIAAYQATSDTLWIADGVSPEAKVPRGLAVRSPLGVVLHELGHANHAHWAPGKYSGDEWMTDNEMDVAIKVSDYALYGKTEFVAEVFASKVAGIEVPPDALALYQKWGGPVVNMVERGGPGSGHYGHAGRPGERGGSLPGDATAQGDADAGTGTGDEFESRLKEKYGTAPWSDWSQGTWIGRDGTLLAPGEDHQRVAMDLVGGRPDDGSPAWAEDSEDATDQLVGAGLIRYNSSDDELWFDIPSRDGTTDEQRSAMAAMATLLARQNSQWPYLSINVGGPFANHEADAFFGTGKGYEFLGIQDTDSGQAFTERGGPGSGHHGHAGRPGERGGSLPGYHDGFPVVFDGSLKSEGEYRDNKILIGPKFFDLPDGAGIHVLNHEAGHAVSDQMLADGRAFKLQDAGAFTGMFDGREVRGIHGHATPGENVAEAYAVYKEDPAWLAEHYPLAFEAMAAYLVTRGGPGSGHFGHAGRPGERGGSVPGDAAQSSDESSGAWHSQSDPETMDAMKQAMVAGMTDIYGPRPISTMTSVYGIANGSLWVAPDGTILRVPTHWESALRAIESVDQEKIAPAMMGILHRAAGLDRSEFGSAAVSAMYTFGWMRANMSNGALMVELAKQQALTVAQAEIVEDYLDVVPDDLTVDIFDIPSQRLLVSIGSSGTSRQAPANALGLVARGGPGSGHFGHAGRPGDRGGSLPGEAASDESRRASAGHQPATAGKFTSEDIFDRIKTSMQYQAEGNKKYGVKSPDQVVDGLKGGGYWHIWVTPDGEGIRVMDHGSAGNRVRIDIKKAVYGEGMPRTPDVKRIITAHDDYAALYGVGMVRLSGYAARAGAMPSIGVTVPGGDYPAPTRGQAEYISDLYFRLKDADWSVESASGGNVGAWLLVDFETAAPRLGLPLRSAPDQSAYLYIPLISEDAMSAMATEIGRWLNRYAIEGMATPSERLHCTLLYLERVTEEQIQRMFEGLALPLKFRCEVTGLARMGDALVALLDPDPALLRLQKDLWMAAKRVGATIGSFSNPAEYKPHISLAYDLPPLLRLEDLNMDPAMFTHGEKLDVACSAFAIGREDKDGLRTIVLPSHAGDRLFVIQGGVAIQPHIIKGRPMVELTQEQWKTVMRGQPVYLRGTRRLITRADGPFRVRGGEGSGHYGHAGIPGHQGGSLPGEAGQAGEEHERGGSVPDGETSISEAKRPVAVISGRRSNMDTELLASWSGLATADWKDEDQARVVDWCRKFATPIKREPEEYERTDGVIAPTGEMFRVDDHGGHEGFSKWALREVLEEKGGKPIGEVSEGGSPGEEMLMALGFTRMSHGGSGGFTRAVPSVALEWRNGAGQTSHQQSLIMEIAKHAIDGDATVLWRDGQFFGAVNRLPNRDFTAAVTGQLDEIDPMLERSVLPAWSERFFIRRGGPGSGHFDHAGIPGHQGGSLPSGVAGKFETEEQGARAAEAEGWTRNRNIQSGNLHYQSPRIQVGVKDGEAVWRQQQATLRYDAVDGYHWEVSEEKHAIGATSDEAFGVSGKVIVFEPEKQPAAPRASSGRPSGGRTRGGAPAGYKYKPAAGGLSLTNPLAGSRAGFGAVTAMGTTRSDLAERGGPGSGNFGHQGRPGERGGSLPGDAGQAGEEAQTSVASADAVDFERRLLERFGDTEPVAGTWIGPSGKYLVHLGDHQETAMWLLGRDPESIQGHGKRIEAGLMATNDVVRAGLVRYNIATDFVYFDIPSRAQTTQEQKDAMALVVEKVGEDQGRWPFAVITLGPPFTNLPDDAKWEEEGPITTERAYKFLGIEDFEPYTPFVPAVERRESLLSSIYRAIEAVIRGGEGSGHRGHQGIPGHRGGSLPSEGGPKEPVKKPRAPRKPREAKPKPASKPAPKPAPPAHTGTRPKPAAAPVIKRKDVSSSYLRRTMSRMAEDYAQRRFDGTIDSFAEYMRTQATNLYFTDRIAAMFAEVLQKDESSPEVLEAMANFFDKAAQSPFDALVRAETTKVAKEQYEPGESRALSDLAAVPTPPRFDAVRAGFEAIDSVHTVPDFTNQILRPTPELQLPILETTRGDRYGAYISLGAKAVSIRFNLGMTDEHAEMTTAHEVGHMIDHLALGSANGVAGTRVLGPVANYQADVDEGRMRTAMGGDEATDDAIERVGNLREVMQAVTNTSSYFSLRAFPAGPSTVTRGGKDYEVYIDRAFLNQAARPSELFARAYSQYISVRSGNANMRSQLSGFQAESSRGSIPLQWQDDEFKPVAAAFDKLFGDAGWLNK